MAQGPRGCRIPGKAAGQWAQRGEGRRECWGVRSVPPRSPLRCDLGKAPPSQEEGAGRQPQRQGHLLLPHPCLHRGTHLEGLQEQGADLRGWGPPREGKPCQPPADGACLPGCPGDRRGGGGLLWGERTLHLKGPHLEVSWAPEGEAPVPPRPCSSPALLRSHSTPPRHPDTSGPLRTSPHLGSRAPTPLLPPGPHPPCSQGDIPQAPREYSQGRRGWWICSPVFSDSSSQTRPLASRDRLGSGSLEGDPTSPGEWGREPVTGAGGC